MQRVQLESTSLASVLYDPLPRLLEIEFRSGERYLYFRVPSHCYQKFLNAESKGAYFNRNIRNCFPCQHLSIPASPVVLADPHKTK